MNSKSALKSKPVSTTNSANRTPLPKEEVDGFYQALQKTNMLDVVEAIKIEKITKL
jgi:hypothetical protein